MTLFKRYRPKYRHVAVEAKAVRALFPSVHGAIPKIALTFIMTDGSEQTFELEATEAAKLIDQSIAAYHAIVPQLKTGRGSWGF
jgi:hypothetical protein